jgi:cell division protease FtsH
MGGGNDEREQTLNQILVEMDGFEPTEKVIVMAATNRPDVLDPALLRPGRFDRRVMLDQPDKKDREEILKIHAKKKPLSEEVDMTVIAERTPGFSGADLANVMNEAAILAAREDRLKVTQYDLLRSVEKVMMGPERKSHILSTQEKKITAYHEMGHALVSSLLEFADPVHKVSIIARGNAAGYTLKLPFEDRKLQSRKEFLADLAMSLGGYAAEKMIFDDLTTGASNDIQVATALARDMVTRYGMSEEIGPVALDSGARASATGGWLAEKIISEDTSRQIDEEVSKLMNGALARAEEILQTNKKALDSLADELIKVETLEREDFEKLLILNGIKPKEKPGNKEGEVFVPDLS